MHVDNGKKQQVTRKTLVSYHHTNMDLLVNLSKPRFVLLELGLLDAHGLKGFPDELTVLLAGVPLKGRVQSARVPGLSLGILGLIQDR